MKPFLDRFILGFPMLLLKQYPHAWIAVAAFLTRIPWLSVFFLGIIVLGILTLHWQRAAWISSIRRQHAGPDGKFHVDQPPIAWKNTIRPIATLVVLSAVLSYLLDGQFGLRSWQYFVMAIGFTVLYRDGYFFGPNATYIVTATGIGIHFVPGHIDYRLFLPFKEIRRIERGEYRKSRDIDVFARVQDAKDGLLLVPKDPHGFSKQVDKLVIVPSDVDAFVEQLPYGYGKTSQI